MCDHFNFKFDLCSHLEQRDRLYVHYSLIAEQPATAFMDCPCAVLT